jgi:hypothetical protein
MRWARRAEPSERRIGVASRKNLQMSESRPNLELREIGADDWEFNLIAVVDQGVRPDAPDERLMTRALTTSVAP